MKLCIYIIIWGDIGVCVRSKNPRVKKGREGARGEREVDVVVEMLTERHMQSLNDGIAGGQSISLKLFFFI